MRYPYLADTQFLLEVDKLNIKEQYVRITILDWSEAPIAEIQGRVSAGSINLDGSSSVRRSGNITFVCDDEYYNVLNINNLISINKKITIDIGFSNVLDKYPEHETLWFPQGTFIIINPSITHNGQGLTVQISFKDKMCLLNGECGGVLPASVTFHEREENDGSISRVTYKDLLYKLLQEYGGESLNKIIINDVPDRVKQVMKYVGEEEITIDTYSNLSWQSTTKSISSAEQALIHTFNTAGIYTVTINTEAPHYTVVIGDHRYEHNIDEEETLTFPLMLELTSNGTSFIIENHSSSTQIFNIAYGKWSKQTAPQVWAPETDVGYVYTDFCPTAELIGNAGQTVVTILDAVKKQLGNYEYYYDIDGNFIFQEIKNYLNTSQSMSEYQSISNTADGYLFSPASSQAIYAFKDGQLITSYQNTPSYANVKNDYIVWGIRETAAGAKLPIRYHLAIDNKPLTGNMYRYDTNSEGEIIAAWPYVAGYGTKRLMTQSYLTELFFQGLVAETAGIQIPNRYYVELKNEWHKIFKIEDRGPYAVDVPIAEDLSEIALDYYLDLIDPTSKVGEFSVSAVGVRSKVWSDKAVNCIFERTPPNAIIIEMGSLSAEEDRMEAARAGDVFYQVNPSVYDQLAGGGYQNSAFSAIRDILYQYTNYNESITISALPVYYLEPNTRITVEDEKSSIHGDYIIKTISRPFDCTGTMNITATKALTRF